MASIQGTVSILRVSAQASGTHRRIDHYTASETTGDGAISTKGSTAWVVRNRPVTVGNPHDGEGHREPRSKTPRVIYRTRGPLGEEGVRARTHTGDAVL